jgi:hypothetical protein
MMRISASRIAGAVALGALVLVVAVLLAGRSRVLGLISTRDWVSFEVPANAVPLNADFEVTSEGVTVCNRGPEPWKDILVQINGLYVAELDFLKSGDCKQIAFSRFEMKSWKRNPGYPKMHVSRIEVLASDLRRGYSSRSF